MQVRRGQLTVWPAAEDEVSQQVDSTGEQNNMGRRRGFFAEMQHQAAVAERDRQRREAAAHRAHAQAVRRSEQARAKMERDRAAAARADAKERTRLEKEAARAHHEARVAEVDAMNAQLEALRSDVDDVLNWTLSIDDHVDLEALRAVAAHPNFTSPHTAPTRKPAPVPRLTEPVLDSPAAPTGLSALFGKKKHAAAVAAAEASHQAAHLYWQGEMAKIPAREAAAAREYERLESARLAALAADEAAYAAECQERQSEVDGANIQLDMLIAQHQMGEQTAVEEYFSIVFGNSVYPDGIEVAVDQTYDQMAKELRVELVLPHPQDLPTVKTYRYVKAKDEIAETGLSAKDQKDRYNAFVGNVALRSLHEVWESDRLGHVATISLTAGVEHVDPATGRDTFTPLLSVAAPREEFESFDLSKVDSAETLKLLKAVVSKNAYALNPIVDAGGVR